MTSDARKRQAGELRLLIMDPSDIHQVRRLDDLIQKYLDDPSVPQYLSTADLLAKALHEFANPTKPDEPTGLGAVVEDNRGDLWVRVKGDSWACGLSRREWADIDATRVLSDGVQP